MAAMAKVSNKNMNYIKYVSNITYYIKFNIIKNLKFIGVK